MDNGKLGLSVDDNPRRFINGNRYDIDMSFPIGNNSGNQQATSLKSVAKVKSFPNLTDKIRWPN